MSDPVMPPAPEASITRTIRPIKIQRGDQRANFKTVFSYGGPRSGKTRWMGTWPKLLVVADATERGWSTLETMPSDVFYDADIPPEVWPVENAAQMAEAIRDAEPLIRRGDYFTLGVDSVTFYADTWFNAIVKRWGEVNKNKPLDTRAIYGGLASHMQDLRIQIHKWPCNVVWLSLESAGDADRPRGGPMLPGKTREKFPAGCDHIFYHRSYTYPDENGDLVPYFEMHCGAFGNWMIGGRDSGMLPSSIFNPTYREFAELLKLPDPHEVHERVLAEEKARVVVGPASAANPAKPVQQPVRRIVATAAPTTPTK